MPSATDFLDAPPSASAFLDATPSPTPTPTPSVGPEGGGRDLLFYKSGQTQPQREELNAPLREAMQVPAVSPEAISQVLQALNTTDEQGPAQQGIDEKVSQALSSMTTGEGVSSAPLYMFPPTAAGVTAENVEQIPSQVEQAAQQFSEGDVQQGAGTTTEALLNALSAAGVAHGGVPFVPETVPPPPIGTPLVGKPLVGPPGTPTAAESVPWYSLGPGAPDAPLPQPQAAQLPVSQEGVPPLIQPGDEPYAGVTPQVPSPEGNPPGIANRYVEEQIYRGELPPEAMATGTGTTAVAAAQEARARLAEDPQAAFTAARRIRNGLARGGDTALLHAYNDQLAEGAAQTRQAAFENPNDAGLSAAADNAEKAHIDFLQNVKPLAGGLVQRLMVGFQGAYPPDLATYQGMYKEMTQLNEGRLVPKEIRSNLYRRAAKVEKVEKAIKAKSDELDQVRNKTLPKRPVPTKEQMSATMEDFKRKVAPCP